MKPASSPSTSEEAILRARARSLAQPPLVEPAADTQLQVLEFRLAEERYAVESSYVTAVLAVKEITPLPGAPGYVRGIVAVRGRVLAVLDLRRLFDIPETGLPDMGHLILLRGGDVEFGLLADRIVGVNALALTTLQPALPTLTEIRAEYLRGITPDHLVVLDLAGVVADPKLIVHQEPDLSGAATHSETTQPQPRNRS